jgi:hypothetical protein
MHITLTTCEELSEVDKRVLRALLAEPEPVAAPKATVKKAAPKPVVEEPAPAPEAKPAPTDKPLPLSKATELAVELMNQGKREELKAALEKVGVKRVGELEGDETTPNRVAEFIAALS